MEEQNIQLPEPIHVKTIHNKLDVFSENNEFKQWTGNYRIDVLFYLYLFNKYKHNCLLKYKSPNSNNTINLELQIKEDKDIPIQKQIDSKKHITQIAIQLSNCIKKGLSIITIPLYLKTFKGGHANLLIYRKQNNVIEHFEPMGAGFLHDAPNIKKLINPKLDEFISILNKQLPKELQVQLVTADAVCPFFDGIQNIEAKAGKKEILGSGYCAAWGMFFTELALKNPNISSNELINIIYDKLNKLSEKDRNNYMRQIIVGYVNLIHNKIEKYFSIIFGKNISATELMIIFKERKAKDANFFDNIETIIDIEQELLNDPSLTKEDYLQYITRKITRTSNPSEKSRLISQKKMLQNIDILLNASPISEQYNTSSKKTSSSISSVHLSSLSSSKSPSKKTSSSISSVHLSSLSSSKSSPKSSPKSSSKSSSKSSPKKSISSISSVHLSSLSSSQESNEPINLVELNRTLPSKSKSASQKSSRSSFFKSAFKSKSPSPKNITQKSNSSLKNSVNTLKSSIDSLKNSVNTLEDVSFSIDLSTNPSSKKSDKSLKNSINSIKSSISSIKDSLNTIDVSFSIDLSTKSKTSSSKKAISPLNNSISSLTDSFKNNNSESSSKNNISQKSSSSNKEKTRCDNKTLKPCSVTQIRNPITCRCNNITTKRKVKKVGCENKKLKSCSDKQNRNPITCRCNKIKVNNTRKRKICEPEKLGPCTNNRVRNSITCRCRKIKV